MAERPTCAPACQGGERVVLPTSRNKLLASLSSTDFGLLEPHLQPADLPVRKSLEKPNKRIGAAYFIESGFVSVVAIQSSSRQVEVGLIGPEGMSGSALVLGTD